MRGLSAASVIYLSKYNYFLGKRGEHLGETARGPKAKRQRRRRTTTLRAYNSPSSSYTRPKERADGGGGVRLSIYAPVVGRVRPSAELDRIRIDIQDTTNTPQTKSADDTNHRNLR